MTRCCPRAVASPSRRLGSSEGGSGGLNVTFALLRFRRAQALCKVIGEQAKGTHSELEQSAEHC